jgi:hypothetical protein
MDKTILIQFFKSKRSAAFPGVKALDQCPGSFREPSMESSGKTGPKVHVDENIIRGLSKRSGIIFDGNKIEDITPIQSMKWD